MSAWTPTLILAFITGQVCEHDIGGVILVVFGKLAQQFDDLLQ